MLLKRIDYLPWSYTYMAHGWMACPESPEVWHSLANPDRAMGESCQWPEVRRWFSHGTPGFLNHFKLVINNLDVIWRKMWRYEILNSFGVCVSDMRPLFAKGLRLELQITLLSQRSMSQVHLTKTVCTINKASLVVPFTVQKFNGTNSRWQSVLFGKPVDFDFVHPKQRMHHI